VLAAPKGHPLLTAPNPAIPDVVKHSFLLPKQGRQRELILNLFRMQDVQPKTVMEVESGELMKRFIVAGLGIGFLPSANIADEARRGILSIVKVESLRLSRDLGIVYLKGKPLTRATRAFLEIATRDIGGPGSAGLPS
jgi:DNA-binding transcriptional LysR family regulator